MKRRSKRVLSTRKDVILESSYQDLRSYNSFSFVLQRYVLEVLPVRLPIDETLEKLVKETLDQTRTDRKAQPC